MPKNAETKDLVRYRQTGAGLLALFVVEAPSELVASILFGLTALPPGIVDTGGLAAFRTPPGPILILLLADRVDTAPGRFPRPILE